MEHFLRAIEFGVTLATFVGVCIIVYQINEFAKAGAKAMEAGDELLEAATGVAAKIMSEAFAATPVEPPDTFDPREDDL